jgi:hypothetical protein
LGTKLVRVIYLDETGHSYKEPVAAVAGVILDPDRQWRLMADEIEKLKETVPAQFRDAAFASKEEEILLQIADACAWTFQRHMKAGDQSERFINAMFGDFAHPADLSKMRAEPANCYGFAWIERAQVS